MHKSPSDRIGSNYTPTSKHLRIKGIRELKRSMQIQRYVTLSRRKYSKKYEYNLSYDQLNFQKLYRNLL